MSHIKRLITKCLSAMAVVLIAAGVEIPAYAASDSVGVSLSVSQIFVNHTTSKVEETFSYVLTPLETGNPMPGQSVDRYSFTVKGSEEVKLEEIAFTGPGTYRYELKQTMESEKEGYTYDAEVYTVEIYVTSTSDGGLMVNTVAYTGNEGKTDQISFENSYQKDAVPSPPGSVPKTGDTGNLTLWFVLMILSAAGLAVVLVCKKKGGQPNKDDRAK